MRSEQEVNRALEQYADTIQRICMIHLKNYHDTEDIFQTVFLKYVLSSVVFENAEHEKAWFIRVTLNACKDLLKSFFHSHTVPLEEWTGQMEDQVPEHSEVLAAVLSLPVKYRKLYVFQGKTLQIFKKITFQIQTAKPLLRLYNIVPRI